MRRLARAVLLCFALPLLAQKPPAAMAAIREADLRRDLFVLGGDAMRGREAGTVDELRASGWLVEQMRAAGLEPAGLDGTWYQWWPMRHIQQAATSTFAVPGQSVLSLWRDVIVRSPVEGRFNLPLVDADKLPADARLDGQAAVATLVPVNANRWGSLQAYRDGSAGAGRLTQTLVARGAAAVVLVADASTDSAFAFFASAASRGTYGLDTGDVARPRVAPPVLLVRRSLGDALRTTGARLALDLHVDSYAYPSVNIIGRVRGTDPKLRDEVVLYSGHQDHDGVRYPVDGDSIWNGADDNGTTSVALLAIARAYVKQPAKRTALFVWHGAEERGLLGSRWHALRPVVPLASIVAVLNADMIGRNHPDSLSLLGSQPPHRNSTQLVQWALDWNTRQVHFLVDSTWDRPTHPEGFYFRSDHLPYARAGIPAIYFTSTLHSDYHTPRDEPSRIDYAKLRRVAQWMYLTGWTAANAPSRPILDAGAKLER
jgi:hypothetical protein